MHKVALQTNVVIAHLISPLTLPSAVFPIIIYQSSDHLTLDCIKQVSAYTDKVKQIKLKILELHWKEFNLRMTVEFPKSLYKCQLNGYVAMTQ